MRKNRAEPKWKKIMMLRFCFGEIAEKKMVLHFFHSSKLCSGFAFMVTIL